MSDHQSLLKLIGFPGVSLPIELMKQVDDLFKP